MRAILRVTTPAPLLVQFLLVRLLGLAVSANLALEQIYLRLFGR